MKTIDNRIWNGQRPLLERNFYHYTKAEFGALTLSFATENVENETDWYVCDEENTFIVLLNGQLSHYSFHFHNGPSGVAAPSKGDVWIIPAGCQYAAFAKGGFIQFVEYKVTGSLVNNASLKACVGHRDDFLFGASSRMYELLDRNDDLSRLAAYSIADALQLHFMDGYGHSIRQKRARDLSPHDLNLLKSTLREQLDGHHSIQRLAALVGMDVRRFSASFSKAFGVPPWQYLLRLRLTESARLLVSSKRTVTEIALAVGFSSPSHFTTAFSKKFGVTPIRYRQLQT